MSNTAYQRSTADLKQAGLNPMLAYSQGGASTPQGASANMVAPRMEDALGKGLSSALDTQRLKNEMKSMEADIALKDAQKQTQQAQTKLNENSARVADMNARVTQAQLPAITKRAKVDAKQAEYDEIAAPYDAVMKRVGQGTSIITDAVSAMTPKIRIERPGPPRSETEALHRAGKWGIPVTKPPRRPLP